MELLESSRKLIELVQWQRDLHLLERSVEADWRQTGVVGLALSAGVSAQQDLMK
jgi:hypothetical protein